HISSSNGSGDIVDLQTVSLSLDHRGRASTQANGHVDARVFQVAGMCVALGAVADDRDLLALDDGEIAIFIVENFHGITPVAGLTAFLEKVLDAQHFVATGNPGDTAAHDFQNRGGPDGLDETVQLVGGTCQLDGVDAGRHVDDLPTEDVGGALDLGTLCAGGLDLDQHQLALDVRAFRKIHQL